MLKKFVYCAWFRNLALPTDEQDSEWPACFIIEASTAEEALGWGDHLSKVFSDRRGTEIYLRSEVEDMSAAKGDLSLLPVVSVGYEASDSEIGW